jgi:hypothetical protein
MCGQEIVAKRVNAFHERKSCMTSNLPVALRVQWTFDNHLNDTYLNYQGIGVNMPTYRSPGINGYGSCLNLVRASLQSVIFPSPPFLDMSYKSFTLTAWVTANSFFVSSTGSCSDNAIFGQHEASLVDKSLHIAVRKRRLYLGFYNNDLGGNQNLDVNIWYHVSIVQTVICVWQHRLSYR